MNESAMRKSAVASSVGGPQMKILMGVRCAAWFAVQMFAYLSDLALARSPCLGTHLKILNIINSNVPVACALVESPGGFHSRNYSFVISLKQLKKGTSILIPWEVKMADISKDDVQTYVRELISKEFESINNENKAPSDKRKLNKREHRDQQNRPA